MENFFSDFMISPLCMRVRCRQWLDVSIWLNYMECWWKQLRSARSGYSRFCIIDVHLLLSSQSPLTLRKVVFVWSELIISTSFSIPYLLHMDHWIDFTMLKHENHCIAYIALSCPAWSFIYCNWFEIETTASRR